jgi:hypothetical protein
MISILAACDEPYYAPDTNVPRDYFVAFLLAFEVCPTEDFPASN